MKNKLNIFAMLAAIMLFIMLCNNGSQVFAETSKAAMPYKSAILVETNTGQILYQYDSEKVVAQASLTKLMTYYTFMRLVEEKRLDLTKRIKINAKGFNIPVGGTQIGLKKGDVLSINDLLTSLLVVSANDSAEALKQIYNSYGKNMIADMNRQSKGLGLNNSKFVSVSGLTNETGKKKSYNVTTALELSKLACLILREYPGVLDTTSKTFCVINGKKYLSTNKLLAKYKRVDGLKTGRTAEAGFCFAVTQDATLEMGQGKNTRLLAIVLGCKTDAARFGEAKKLLDYAMADYVNYKAVSVDSGIRIDNEYYKDGFIKCSPKDDLHILKKSSDRVSKSIEFTNKLNKNITKGEKVGIVKVRAGNKEIIEELYASNDYRMKALPLRILISIKKFLGGLF